FRHAIFREVLYERLRPSMRAELHRKVGTALEQERAAGRTVKASELAVHFERGLAPMAALRYYAQAAEAALLNLSPTECLSLTERALSLIDRAPPDAERTTLEFSLATLRGEAAFHVLGVGQEARAAYQRANSLLHQVPRHPMRGLLVQGFGLVLNLRAEYAEALATANSADALAAETNDSSLALAAHTVQSHVFMMRGRPREARKSLERSIPAIESTDGVAERSFDADPQVMLLGLLSLQLAHLGLIKQSRERLQQAYARARGLGQPVALMVAIWLDTLIEVRVGDASRIAALADELRALVEEADLAQGRTAWRWFGGLAMARSGKALVGYRQIRAAYEDDKPTGRIAGDTENLGYAAEALVLHGDWQAAQEPLEQALEMVRTYGERIYLPQLLLIEGAIAGARGDPAAAEAAIRRAVEEAREQGAAWLELLALTALCEQAGAAVKDRRALATLVSKLPEANETSAIARARALLASV
ncbi:MAG: transcriptional regulator, partial [Pseudomonadota bacterium]|nr:transcriptional regulator [Pseudomonadota bacterium]